MMVAATARPAGDAGVSTISSAAGKNAVSSDLARPADLGNATIFLTDFMDARLETIEVGIASRRTDQLVVRPVLDDPTLFDSDNAMGPTHGRETMSDDQGGTALDDLSHVVLNDLFALVVKCAGRFVKNEDARIHNQRARYGNSLPLPTGEAIASLADHGVVPFGQL